MFKNIQKYLLIHQPLLWNLKIVPISIMLVLFHILFFIIGYCNGTLNFVETERNYSRDNESITIFFGVLSALIILILWLVYYFKNNAFKSFYPKKNNSLFKEWLLILVICLLLSTFSASYISGKNLKIRSYFTETELKKRCEIISQASIFYEGSYQEPKEVEIKVNDTLKSVPLDYFIFQGKKYDLYSLLNKNVENFSIFNSKEDSIRKVTVKTWLVNNEKDKIKSLFSEYLKIAKEHQLVANIDEEKWLSLVYNYPDFVSKYKVATYEKDEYSNYNYSNNNEVAVAAIPENEEKFDTINRYIKYVGEERIVYNKYFVPAGAINYNYTIISESYSNPLVNYEMLLVMFYFALGLSIALFSFRVTSGKSWLIALVSVGVFNIILGITSAIASSEYVYLIGVASMITFVFIYFLFVIYRKKGKAISAILLNVLLWSYGAFFPILYFLAMIIFKSLSNYYNYNGGVTINTEDANYKMYRLLEDNIEYMLYVNLAIIFIVMFFFSYKIKQWKGVAEN